LTTEGIEKEKSELQHQCVSCERTAQVAEEKPAEEIMEAPKTAPEATVTGNEKIAIVKHQLIDIQVYNTIYQTGVELAIKNVSNSTIATLIFEATFYDKNGNILDSGRHRELDLRPGVTRGIGIKSKIIEHDRLKSYQVKIVKMTTTDTEKVQLRRQDLKFGVSGEAEFSGTAKNISDVKTDAAVIATFYNHQKETVGDKVLLLKNLEPGKIRTVNFRFQPQEGDIADSCNIKIVSDIAEMTEETA
jgi:hypothetical protein